MTRFTQRRWARERPRPGPANSAIPPSTIISSRGAAQKTAGETEEGRVAHRDETTYLLCRDERPRDCETGGEAGRARWPSRTRGGGVLYREREAQAAPWKSGTGLSAGAPPRAQSNSRCPLGRLMISQRACFLTTRCHVRSCTATQPQPQPPSPRVGCCVWLLFLSAPPLHYTYSAPSIVTLSSVKRGGEFFLCTNPIRADEQDIFIEVGTEYRC